MPKNRATRGRKGPRGGQSFRGKRSKSITTAVRPILPEAEMDNSFTPTKEDLQHLDKVCRLCMVRGGPTMEHIFRYSGSNSIAAQITWVTQLEMRQEDPLPSHICQQCIFRLTLSQNFKQQCVSSDQTLRELYLKKKQSSGVITSVASTSQDSGLNSHKEEVEQTTHVNTSYTLKVEPLSPCSQEDDYDDKDEENTETAPQIGDFKIEIVEHSLDEPSTSSKTKSTVVKTDANAPFVCEECHRTYPTWDQLRRHRVYHSEKRVPCPECDRKFLRRAQLRRHLLWHSGEKPFACAECGKKFAAQTTLDVHTRSHSGVKLFKCHLCDKTFGHNSTLTTHVRAHLGDRPYQCPTCPQSFTAKSPLDKHIRTHTGFKPHKCPDCPLSFTLPSSLRTHSRTHTGERPYPCPHCDKSFAQPGGLKNHVRIHTGSKPYECKICNKTYRQQGAYSIHMRTHANVRPYSCDVCSRSFNVKKTLARHCRIHTGEKTFECPVCRQAFSRDDSLASHMLIHSDERPFECLICNKSFRQKVTLVLHMRCHTGERPYECDYCQMTFAQKGTMMTHMRVHTGEKPFNCSQCEKVFAQLGNLIDHKKRHHPYGEDPKGDEAIQEILDAADDEEDEEDVDDEDESDAEEALYNADGEEKLNKTEDKVPHCCQLCSKTFLKLKTLIWHVERFHSGADEVRKKKNKTIKGRTRKAGDVSVETPSIGNVEEITTNIAKTDIKSEIETKMDDETVAKDTNKYTESIASVSKELTSVDHFTNVASKTVSEKTISRSPDSQTAINTNTTETDAPIVKEIPYTQVTDIPEIRSTAYIVEADRTTDSGDTFQLTHQSCPTKPLKDDNDSTEVIATSATSIKGIDTNMPNTSHCTEAYTSKGELIESKHTFTGNTESTTPNSVSASTNVTNYEIVEQNSFHKKFIADNFKDISSPAETIDVASDAVKVVKTNATEMETENSDFSEKGFIENTSNPSSYLHV